ncbi:hypothetical protein BD780_000880 [Clostridium tetanomorphum]|uniref:Uncharacterized protein n=1 Tax=Clostridium tetanomorphum TaxID=1553 RepID=A0A923J2J7_CLOTT|nr:hypothetical protein [Clostridium tetanomorphum]KAJ53098.1 hypothetical protein CTM_04170 [Clostridium tetanomorphum DSM 665]MBC2398785.1 hypothetical protein [Clostridium tetanomorphum]MBP1863556.1 hypothetical protein [Clostridium tetanomorphum]NRS83655.1 hypothetical protein [Clostridium tetanomorphum]NRZ96849.1 hypothetical protein [Clostridium tetanomorphum]
MLLDFTRNYGSGNILSHKDNANMFNYNQNNHLKLYKKTDEKIDTIEAIDSWRIQKSKLTKLLKISKEKYQKKK